MGTITACCGHEVKGGDAFKGYYWKEWSREYEPELSYGNLCPKCISVYHAIEAKDWKEAKELLANVEPVGLIDILEKQYGGQRQIKNIGGIDFEILELPPKS